MEVSTTHLIIQMEKGEIPVGEEPDNSGETSVPAEANNDLNRPSSPPILPATPTVLPRVMNTNAIPEECAADEFIDHDASLLLRELDGSSSTFPDAHGVLVGDHVFTYMPFGDGERVIHFTRKQYVFLNALLESNNPEYAAKRAGVSLEMALKWFRSKKYKEYFAERKRERALSMGLSAESLAAMGADVLSGKKEFTKSQMQVWTMLFSKFVGDPTPRKKTLPTDVEEGSTHTRTLSIDEQWVVTTRNPIGGPGY